MMSEVNYFPRPRLRRGCFGLETMSQNNKSKDLQPAHPRQRRGRGTKQT
jgi:hypothetical protein